MAALGRYQIRGEMGRGNMGVVYRAHDPIIERSVALKTVILPESITEAERESFLKRFFQEAKTAGRLLHPNIVVTYDAATDAATGTPFIAMELIEGESLREKLDREGRIDWRQAVEWIVSLAGALQHAHASGIVHRDIKPANIMITREGVPKITDFGIAKLPSASLTQTGVVIGTPYFMSPEQLRGEALDGRSDLFSLGGLLYNLVVGTPPFHGTDIASIASQVLYKSPRPASEAASDLPLSLDGVIARALMKSADDRYASGEELARDLLAVREGAPAARAVPAVEQTRPSRISVPESEPAPPVERRPTATEVTIETIRSARRSRPLALVAAAIGLALLAMALAFREDLAERKLLFDARRAAKSGELELGERKLEEVLSRNPGLEPASDLLLEVSSSLVLPELPLELTAKHHHRLGSCTGRLTMAGDRLEYRSKSHGRWEWRFEHLRALDVGGSSELSVQTHEDDMLGLLDRKNYKFSLLDASPGEDFWKRFERHVEYMRARGIGGGR